MRLLYSVFIRFYSFAIKTASLFNKKAAQFVSGRKDVFKYIDNNIYNKHQNIVWVHCASLGEFEQARPLIEKLKRESEKHKILLTFFSPSGYEVRKNYDKADWVLYLPMDTLSNARDFVRKVKPEIAVFVKYEFWFNYLKALSDSNISIYFISVILRKEHYFFKWYGSWALKQLKKIDHLFVQDSLTLELLNAHHISQTTLTGDTRFDRVYEIAQKANSFPIVEAFKGENLLMVAGSSWQQDEALIKEFADLYNSKKLPNLKILIAPHNLSESNILHIERLFENTVRYSQAVADLSHFDVLIIDNVGMLSSLYKYSDYTYIGGGFGAAVHNTLEAAVFGMPLFFGPNYRKFKEIHDLIANGSARCVSNATELYKYVDIYISDKELYLKSSNSARQYVTDNIGATDKILKSIINSR